jgi:hypothetical protein
MDRGFDIPWVGGQKTMEKGFDIPWVGVQNTIGWGFDIPWVGGSKDNGKGLQYTMGRGHLSEETVNRLLNE